MNPEFKFYMLTETSRIGSLIRLLAFFLLSSITNAESSGHLEHGHSSQQETHLHGVSELTLALDQGRLEMHFESPAANIVGFEHKALTREQIHILDGAKVILDSPGDIFIFSGGNCDLKMSEVDISALLDAPHKQHKAHEDKGHVSHTGHHDKHDKHDKRVDHEHKRPEAHQDHHENLSDSSNDHNERHETAHTEITAEYKFLCKHGEALSAIQVELMKLFPGIEKLKVYWLTESKQGTVVLSKNFDMIDIR